MCKKLYYVYHTHRKINNPSSVFQIIHNRYCNYYVNNK